MTLATKQFEWSVNTIIAIVFIIAIAVAGFIVYGWWNSAKVNEATVIEQGSTAQATTQTAAKVDAAIAESDKDEATANDSRRSYATNYQRAASADPSARAWGDGVIADSVRAAARKSREARDGPADIEAGRARPDGGTEADRGDSAPRRSEVQ